MNYECDYCKKDVEGDSSNKEIKYKDYEVIPHNSCYHCMLLNIKRLMEKGEENEE